MKVFKVRRNGEDYFRVELPRDFTPSGKRRSVVARSHREALEKAQQLLDQQKKGLKIDESRSSLSEFLREFLEFTRAKAALHFGLGKIIGTTSSKNIAPGLGVVLIELKPRHVDIWMKSLGDRASALGPSSTPRPPCAGLFKFAVERTAIPPKRWSACSAPAARARRKKDPEITANCVGST